MKHRTLASLFLVCLLVLLGGVNAVAYVERGPVGISADTESLVLKKGESGTVHVTLDPEYEVQLPGCGLASCPQTCDNTCLTKDGSCSCGPTNYETYVTAVAAASSDPAVVQVSYADGAAEIRAIGAGKASVTLTASLKEHDDTAVEIAVTVEAGISTAAVIGICAAAVLLSAVTIIVIKKRRKP